MRKRETSKRLSCPQTIVLLDILFIFLIVLLMNAMENNGIEVSIPETGIFDCAEIIRVDSLVRPVQWKKGGRQWKSAEELKQHLTGNAYEFFPCENTCAELGKPYPKEELRVMLSGELFNTVSRLTYAACRENTHSCKSLKISITEDGLIDTNKLLNENDFLRDIHGIEYFLKTEKNDEKCTDFSSFVPASSRL